MVVYYADVVGYRYCLLTTPAFASTFSPARQAELARGQVNVLIDRADALKSWLREHDVEAVMVRPDRYVLGAVKCDADLAALLSEFQTRHVAHRVSGLSRASSNAINHAMRSIIRTTT